MWVIRTRYWSLSRNDHAWGLLRHGHDGEPYRFESREAALQFLGRHRPELLDWPSEYSVEPY